MSLPIIAIVGRPNVGKSTLFNRLIGIRHAITSRIAGTTRDRVYMETEVGGYSVILADTGGMEFSGAKKEGIEADIQTQARVAVEQAHLILFVVDASEPLTSNDLDLAHFLHKSKTHVLLIAHKTDNKISAELIPELYELGLGTPIAVSSIHNEGLIELEEAVGKAFKKMKWKKEKSSASSKVRISIVGKPNVGKSSLVNALLDEPRLIVSDIPGTTIDATDTPFSYAGRDYTLIDTAGLRRRGKRQGLERLGVLRSLAAISRSDVTLLVFDYGTGLANQDLHVSEYILEAGKGIIVVVNKADLMENAHEEQQKFQAKLGYRMGFLSWAPVVFTSAVSKKNIFKLLELATNIADERRKKIPDKEFTIFVKATVLTHPAMRSGHKIIISDGKQTDTAPPTFTFTVNKPDLIHFSYRRFLENELRRKFGFFGTAIRLKFVKSKG